MLVNVLAPMGAMEMAFEGNENWCCFGFCVHRNCDIRFPVGAKDTDRSERRNNIINQIGEGTGRQEPQPATKATAMTSF